VNVNGGWFGIANDSVNSSGSFYNMTGGKLNLNNGVAAEVGADTVGSMNISGTAILNGSGDVFAGLRSGGNGTINLSGNAQINTNNLQAARDGGSTGTINLNGGTVTANIISVGGGNGQVNFNGGGFRNKSDQTEIFPGLTPANSEVKAGGLKIDTNGKTVATSLALDGVGSLIKQGAGTLTLTGITSHTGGTFVADGTLAISATGGIGGAGQIDVGANGTLDVSAAGITVLGNQSLTGKGNINGNVTIAGVLSPGNSIGGLSVAGNLTLASTSLSNFEIIKLGTTDSDNILVSGAITYDGTLNVTVLPGSDPFAFGDTFYLFDGGAYNGNFASINLPATPAGEYFANYLTTNGTLVYIPEPSSMALGVVGLGILARRRRRA
jgi:autotransporter-associated beta strand protein